MNETIEQECTRLLDKLEYLNVHSTGRDRIIQRLKSLGVSPDAIERPYKRVLYPERRNSHPGTKTS